LKISRHQLEIWWWQIEFTIHSNAILNIKMYSCISLGLKFTKSKIPGNIVERPWHINNVLCPVPKTSPCTYVWLSWLTCLKLRDHKLSKVDYEPGDITRQSHAWSTRVLGSLCEPGNKYVMENQEKMDITCLRR
jgi:hypothetical protein